MGVVLSEGLLARQIVLVRLPEGAGSPLLNHWPE